MKKTTVWMILATAAFTLTACDNKTADAVKEKADDAKQAIEAKSEAAKEAATKKIDEATEAAKQAAPAAAAAVDNMGEKAKDATSDAANATKEAADKAVGELLIVPIGYTIRQARAKTARQLAEASVQLRRIC